MIFEMTDQPLTNEITPPPELVHQWADMLSSRSDQSVFTMAAQWGANQELEACCEWLRTLESNVAVNTDRRLRLARRPKPPSLKEQRTRALEALERMQAHIVRALEALDD